MNGQALFFELNWMTLCSAHNFPNLPCWFCSARRDHPLYGVMTLGPNILEMFLYWSWTLPVSGFLDCLRGQGGFINLVDTNYTLPTCFCLCIVSACVQAFTCVTVRMGRSGQFKGGGSSPPLRGAQWLNSDIMLANENFTRCLSHLSWLPLTFL